MLWWIDVGLVKLRICVARKIVIPGRGFVYDVRSRVWTTPTTAGTVSFVYPATDNIQFECPPYSHEPLRVVLQLFFVYSLQWPILLKYSDFWDSRFSLVPLVSLASRLPCTSTAHPIIILHNVRFDRSTVHSMPRLRAHLKGHTHYYTSCITSYVFNIVWLS